VRLVFFAYPAPRFAEEPTEAGADRAVRKWLGVSWRVFYAGWKRCVLSGS